MKPSTITKTDGMKDHSKPIFKENAKEITTQYSKMNDVIASNRQPEKIQNAIHEKNKVQWHHTLNR